MYGTSEMENRKFSNEEEAMSEYNWKTNYWKTKMRNSENGKKLWIRNETVANT